VYRDLFHLRKFHFNVSSNHKNEFPPLVEIDQKVLGHQKNKNKSYSCTIKKSSNVVFAAFGNMWTPDYFSKKGASI